jgi:hypothetical protein
MKLTVTISQNNMGDVIYTGVTCKDGESKADVMARTIDDHRLIFVIDSGVELTATAKVERV